MRKKLLVVVAAFALVLCMPAMAFAANSAFDKGTAESTSYVDSYTGNAFLMERDALNLTVGRDLYWVGDTLNARGLEVGGGTGGSALLAGGTLNVASSTIHGSLRAAGQTVNVSSTTVGNNITIAGQNVSIASDVSACGVYAAGSNVSVSGTYQGAAFAAGTVNLAGSYAGDVNISAGTVNVSRGTTVGGMLRVPNNAQVTIEEGANVPNVSYVDDALVSTVSEGSEQSSFSVIGPLLFSCMAHALLVLLCFLDSRYVHFPPLKEVPSHLEKLRLYGPYKHPHYPLKQLDKLHLMPHQYRRPLPPVPLTSYSKTGLFFPHD